MHRASWTVLLLVALLPTLAVALAPALAGGLHDGGATVRVPAGPRKDGYVVLTSHDPLKGEVVERVVPVQVSPDEGVEVDVGQLRPGVDLTARLLDQDALDGLVGSVAGLVNGTLGGALAAVDGLDLGALLASGTPLGLHAYAYAPIPTSSKDKGIHHPRVLMTPAGILGVAYLGSDFTNGSLAEPFLRVSTDLGHRFGPALRLAPGTNTDVNAAAFASQVGSDGTLLFVTGHQDAERRMASYTVTRVDPLTQAVTATLHDVPAGLHTEGVIPLVLTDSSVVLVAQGTLEASRLDAAGGPPTTVRVETDPSFRGSSHVWAGTGAGDRVAIAWSVVTGTGPALRYATSGDGGRSWTAPVNVTGLPSGADAPAVASGALDELGTLHLAVLVPRNDTTNELRYVAAPPLGAPAVSRLDDGGRGVQYVADVFVAAAGGRVWILGQVAGAGDFVVHPGGYAMRSHTLAWERLPAPVGAREPREFEVQGTAFFHFEGGPALMPDGRLVVLGSSGSAYSVVPTFDPFPEPGCAVRDGTTGSETPRPGVQVASASCEERFTLQSIAGAVQVRPLADGAAPAGGPLVSPGGGLPPAAVQVGVAAAAAAAVVGLASLEAARYGLGLAMASLFSRVQGKKVLQHAIRGGIHDHVQANPGIRFTQIRKDLGLSHGATAYHLRVLERNGLVRARTHWTARRYEPVTGAQPGPPRLRMTSSSTTCAATRVRAPRRSAATSASAASSRTTTCAAWRGPAAFREPRVRPPRPARGRAFAAPGVAHALWGGCRRAAGFDPAGAGAGGGAILCCSAHV